MKNFLKIFLLIVMIIFASCKHKSEMYDGPDLNDVYGPFKIEEVFKMSTDSVDFATGETVYFTAKISKRVDWQISITGLTTGAQKIITGHSNSISATNATWNGSATIFPMFNIEKCVVSLSFPNDTDAVFNDTLHALSPKTHPGFLVNDFEAPYLSNKIIVWKQSGANMNFSMSDTAPVPQGRKYYNMAGRVIWDWAIGYMEIPATANGFTHFPLSTNPENVYFNILVWKGAGIDNAFLLLDFREDDNGDGAFNPANEDDYSYSIQNVGNYVETKPGHAPETITWDGWKLISVKYSDIGDAAAAKGNKQHNPEKLLNFRVFLLADPTSGYTKTRFDYIIFTQGKPLEP